MISFRNLGRLGRFGNQLFQYAGTRLYAQSHGYSWGFPAWDGEQIFDHPPRRSPLISFLSPTLQLDDMTSTGWSERLLKPLGLWQRGSLDALYQRPRDRLSLYGYLQDDASIARLRKHTEEIRGWFHFRPEIDRIYRDITDKHRPWLALHIRRGDLIKRNAATNTDEALSYAQQLRGNRNLFIATDDKALREKLSGKSVITPANPLPNLPPFAFDFWMLKESEVLIGSGSTFAWWAAFLGGAEYWSPPLNRNWGKGSIMPMQRQSV